MVKRRRRLVNVQFCPHKGIAPSRRQGEVKATEGVSCGKTRFFAGSRIEEDASREDQDFGIPMAAQGLPFSVCKGPKIDVRSLCVKTGGARVHARTSI